LGIVLNIETATKNCSVSLADGGNILAFKELNEGTFSHAEKLHSFIIDVLASARLEMKDLDAVAVSKGPGSYTGLRIGVSAAKGLCYALDIPLISTPTLKCLALQIPANTSEHIVPLLDARRMEVYSAVFDGLHNEVRETKAEIIDKESFAGLLEQGKVCFLGDGAEKCEELIRHSNAEFIKGKYPSAKEMAVLANEKFNKTDFEDLAYFEPFYLKDFVAGKPKNYFR
jgi:tRNA threonylcarbamoyladenosine biosynthesis protein TsaB